MKSAININFMIFFRIIIMFLPLNYIVLDSGLINHVFLVTLILITVNILYFIKKHIYVIKENLQYFPYVFLLLTMALFLVNDFLLLFSCNYPELNRIHVFLLDTGLALNILAVFRNKKSTNTWRTIKDLVIKILKCFKKDFFKTIFLGICIALALIIINLFCKFIGITILISSWYLCFVSIYAKIIFFKIIIAITQLLFVKDRDSWYDVVEINPFSILTVFISSLAYYFIMLPVLQIFTISIIELIKHSSSKCHSFFMDTITNRFNSLKPLIISFFRSFTLLLGIIGNYLSELPNRPGQIGKFFVCLADFMLDRKLESIQTKLFMYKKYSSFRIENSWLVDRRNKINHINFMKSLPSILPVNIDVSCFGKKDFGIIYVEGSLDKFCSYLSENATKLNYLMNRLNSIQVDLYLYQQNTKVTLLAHENNLSAKFTDLNVNHVYSDKPLHEFQKNSKPFMDSYFSKENYNKKELLSLTKPNRSDNNLFIWMQNQIPEKNLSLVSKNMDLIINESQKKVDPIRDYLGGAESYLGGVESYYDDFNNIIRNSNNHLSCYTQIKRIHLNKGFKLPTLEYEEFDRLAWAFKNTNKTFPCNVYMYNTKKELLARDWSTDTSTPPFIKHGILVPYQTKDYYINHFENSIYRDNIPKIIFCKSLYINIDEQARYVSIGLAQKIAVEKKLWDTDKNLILNPLCYVTEKKGLLAMDGLLYDADRLIHTEGYLLNYTINRHRLDDILRMYTVKHSDIFDENFMLKFYRKAQQITSVPMDSLTTKIVDRRNPISYLPFESRAGYLEFCRRLSLYFSQHNRDFEDVSTMSISSVLYNIGVNYFWYIKDDELFNYHFSDSQEYVLCYKVLNQILKGVKFHVFSYSDNASIVQNWQEDDTSSMLRNYILKHHRVGLLSFITLQQLFDFLKSDLEKFRSSNNPNYIRAEKILTNNM